MGRKELTPEELKSLVAAFSTFLWNNREQFWNQSVPLRDSQRELLQGYFGQTLLEQIRVHELKNQTLITPGFYELLREWGFNELPDFAAIEAITFVDVIVFASPMSNRTLFHEMVHAEQFRQFGLEGLARLYVSGFLKSGTYEAIPLEIQAYGLGAQFETEPRRPFSVEEEVHRWMHEGKF